MEKGKLLKVITIFLVLCISGAVGFIKYKKASPYGPGTEKCREYLKNDDYKNAFSICTEQAQKGDPIAEVVLATLYLGGLSVERDLYKAEKFFLKAAQSKNKKASTLASYGLGDLYFRNDFERKNYEKSAFWHKKAADNGNKDSQLIYGAMLSNGYGVDQDHEKAKFYFTKAAKQGVAKAKEILDLYEKGDKEVESKSSPKQ